MQMEMSKLKLLGRGSNSEIYRYGGEEQGVVLKMVGAGCSKEAKHLANEHRMLSSLSHQNIIKALKYKERITVADRSQQECASARKCGPRQPARLLQAGAPLPQPDSMDFRGACRGHPLPPLDLKLENVLVSQNDSQIQIKLADFGFATSAQSNHLSTAYKGTRRGYMAPEIHRLATPDCQAPYDMYKADVFALGVILFTLVMGRLPFQFATPENAHYACLDEGRHQDFWGMHQQALSRLDNEEGANLGDFKEMFVAMVSEEASKRPSMEEVAECSWLRGKQQIIKSLGKISESGTAN